MITHAAVFARSLEAVAWPALMLAAAAVSAAVLERTWVAIDRMRVRRFGRQYAATVRRALDGDVTAETMLVTCPARHRIGVARLLITPLIDDRDPARIERVRDVVQAMSLVTDADRYLRSCFWWRRAIALRALGLLQIEGSTPRLVAALDDGNPDVRAAALDALTDLRDPASLTAIVVRMHDPSLPRGRRAAALAAFGSEAEPFLRDLAEVDTVHRADYARALGRVGTNASRATLCRWTEDARADVRVASFEALARLGLDDTSASLALDALRAPDPHVRAAAAGALQGWTGPDTAARLARHLDDQWIVAVSAARSLQAIAPAGLEQLQVYSKRTGLAGLLARQMLWETHVPC